MLSGNTFDIEAQNRGSSCERLLAEAKRLGCMAAYLTSGTVMTFLYGWAAYKCAAGIERVSSDVLWSNKHSMNLLSMAGASFTGVAGIITLGVTCGILYASGKKRESTGKDFLTNMGMVTLAPVVGACYITGKAFESL